MDGHPRDYFWIEKNGTLLPDKCLRRMPDELLVTSGCTTCAVVGANAGEICYIVPSTVNVHQASAIIDDSV